VSRGERADENENENGNGDAPVTFVIPPP